MGYGVDPWPSKPMDGTALASNSPSFERELRKYYLASRPSSLWAYKCLILIYDVEKSFLSSWAPGVPKSQLWSQLRQLKTALKIYHRIHNDKSNFYIKFLKICYEIKLLFKTVNICFGFMMECYLHVTMLDSITYNPKFVTLPFGHDLLKAIKEKQLNNHCKSC